MAVIPHVKEIGILEQVHELEFDRLACELVGFLGRPLVAVAMGVKETKLVAQWERHETKPLPDRERAMRVALQMSLILKPRYSPRAIQSWFMGINRYLEDYSPAEVLAQYTSKPNNDVARRLLNAARAFANR